MPDSEGAVLAFDYGMRFIGVAWGERRSRVCRPLVSLECRTRAQRWESIHALIREWTPKSLLVGLALNSEGQEQTTTRQCRNFARDLHRHTHLPVALIDERYTSLEADQQLQTAGVARAQRRSMEHALAATLLLEDYFGLSMEQQSALCSSERTDFFITLAVEVTDV
ncbi:MAG: Holliday junction resolvase RuvX [Ferrovum myxofaciens]|uniref:Holliday junction resolvase RuvX n=1 Tax=Ferrovum myxofaciens TaxID=416213 RepID=UPI0023535A18|nr:Holliday junction resolvase RuvX [Ferrovum myxofaciens]QKE41250.1 MAG: Holliday junction resolvase RuvX [Ferrovum myxofaciens]